MIGQMIASLVSPVVSSLPAQLSRRALLGGHKAFTPVIDVLSDLRCGGAPVGARPG
jgi:hypothetical protein